MNHHYKDIRLRIDAAPTWFDEHAVPRYCPFGPQEIADIYADQAVLLEIACQQCGKLFLVAISSGPYARLMKGDDTLWEEISDGTIHYGDPPNVECCPAGPMMNSEPRRVVEAWEQKWEQKSMRWERKTELEGKLIDWEQQYK